MLRRGFRTGRISARQVWIDAGYQTEVVYRFCQQSGRVFRPSVGRGVMQQRPSWAGKILQTGSEVKHSGEGYQVVRLKGSKVLLNEVDADHWKSWVHKRLETPLEKPGHLTLFQAAPETHLALARHLTAESKVEEFVAGKGIVTRWERSRRHNHWFDALYNACAAGHLCGVRLFALPKTAPPAKQPAERRTSRRKWVDRERFQRSRRF